MAKAVTAREQEAMAAAAEASRDDETVWDFSNPVDVRLGPRATLKNEAKLTVRMPRKKLDELRDEYAETYPRHRLSFNSWILSRL